MVDVAFNLARRLEADAPSTNRPHHLPKYDDVFGADGAGNARSLADDHAIAVDVALNLTIHPQFTLRNNIANDGEI